MRTRLCALVVAAFAAVLCFCGCDARPQPPQPHGVVVPAQTEIRIPASYDWSKVVTKGNHSYVPLAIGADDYYSANPANHAQEILDVLFAFETAHPEFEITGWRIEKDQKAHMTPAYIYGLWVDHKPREKK